MNHLKNAKELGFPPGLETHCQGWNSNHTIFRAIIEEVSPKVIVEVGTWLGASCLHMAELTQHDGTQIYCVDTWLGGIDHLLSEKPEAQLPKLMGYPQLYYQFLHNVNHTAHAERVFPLPTTSVNGAKYLREQGVKADLIYIDASHEINEVYADIAAYRPLLSEKGVMFGDDYKQFVGVFCDVNRYAAEHFLRVENIDNKFWVLRT